MSTTPKTFTLELLGKQNEQDTKDGLANVKSMYPKAKVRVIKNTKNKTIYEVTNGQ